MADFESKNVAYLPIRGYTGNARRKALTLRSALFVEGGGWELSGGSCKLRFTVSKSFSTTEGVFVFQRFFIS